MSDVLGTRKRSPTDEKCPSCALHGRASWLNVETSLIGGSIEAQLTCPVAICGVIIRRPSFRVAETTHNDSRMTRSFRTLRHRVFTPRVVLSAMAVMALLGFIVFW